LVRCARQSCAGMVRSKRNTWRTCQKS
jgi:hypothetical protein